ncbi:MAG: DUF177 domain-containing protein [Defluviitaleaceae bacterium]|nr:DUF177 domain-containing protein [Defluviitaleaceae bacterium]
MIDAKKIGKKGINIKESFDISIPKNFGAGERAVVDFAGRLFQVDKPHFILEGEGTSTLCAPCGLCLKNCETDVSFAVSENFVDESKDDICEDDIIFHNGVIGILPAISRNLFNNIPMRFVCNDDCQGLCSMCGHNQNLGNCDCAPPVRSEFAELIGKFQD